MFKATGRRGIGSKTDGPLFAPFPVMDPRPHPFPAKVTPEQAAEIRRLRATGVRLAELADRFGIAKSSVSAIVH